MRLFAAFLKMVRLPNLIFIILIKLLFQFCIYYPWYGQGGIDPRDSFRFVLIVLASVFIAAGGYIINDYFDINIDQVNKPEKMVVDKLIRRRWAIVWHFVFSTMGVLLTALALPLREKWYLLLANIFCVVLLWFYSTTFKKKILIGNIIIAVLTAWTILVIFFLKVSLSQAFGLAHVNQSKLFRFAFLYAGFAFILTLIREALKDIEDMHGDAQYGCRTMPVLWGVNVTKVYTAVWLIILLILLLVIQAYILQFGWWAAVIYCLLFIIIPVLYIFFKLFKASATADYHRLSSWTKWVMLTGILSMIFFYFYL